MVGPPFDSSYRRTSFANAAARTAPVKKSPLKISTKDELNRQQPNRILLIDVPLSGCFDLLVETLTGADIVYADSVA